MILHSFCHHPELVTIGEGWNIDWALPFGSPPFSPQRCDTTSALLQMLHQSVRQSFSPFYPHSGTRPWDTWGKDPSTENMFELLPIIQTQLSLWLYTVWIVCTNRPGTPYSHSTPHNTWRVINPLQIHKAVFRLDWQTPMTPQAALQGQELVLFSRVRTESRAFFTAPWQRLSQGVWAVWYP